jgi:hypothetical protein
MLRTWRENEGKEGCTLGILCMWRANLSKVVGGKEPWRKKEEEKQSMPKGGRWPDYALRIYKQKHKWDFFFFFSLYHKQFTPVPEL